MISVSDLTIGEFIEDDLHAVTSQRMTQRPENGIIIALLRKLYY